jgi:hypothetical protein
MYVVKVQRCGLREALFAHFDRPKGSFPRPRARFPVSAALLGLPAAHNRTVVAAFSHSDDWVSSPVRDHGGLARVPLRTDPSVLVGAFGEEWTRSRNRLGSRTPAGLVCESGPRIQPSWQKSRLINPRGQCTW